MDLHDRFDARSGRSGAGSAVLTCAPGAPPAALLDRLTDEEPDRKVESVTAACFDRAWRSVLRTSPGS